jgi:hypothetical protein
MTDAGRKICESSGNNHSIINRNLFYFKLCRFSPSLRCENAAPYCIGDVCRFRRRKQQGCSEKQDNRPGDDERVPFV